MPENAPRTAVSPLAVALAYRPDEPAPRVVAKGRGLVADEIIRRAREAGLFVHASPELVTLLAQVDLDQRIPPALYLAVAELLAWIHAVGEAPSARPAPPAGTGAGIRAGAGPTDAEPAPLAAR